MHRVRAVLADVAADWDPVAERAILGDLDAVADELERLRAVLETRESDLFDVVAALKSCRRERGEAETERERLRAAVALHRPAAPGMGQGCHECYQMWPCPTARAAGMSDG